MKVGAGKIIGAAMFAAGVAAIWLWPKPKAEVVEENVVRPVRSMVVSNRTSFPELRCPGRVRAGETRDLMFEVSGRLVELKFDRGQLVKKGDVLAKLSSTSRGSRSRAARLWRRSTGSWPTGIRSSST